MTPTWKICYLDYSGAKVSYLFSGQWYELANVSLPNSMNGNSSILSVEKVESKQPSF